MVVNKKQIIDLLLIIIWMIFVFFFSNQPADISSKQSGGITERIVKLLLKDNITQNQRDIIETVIRKCAHFVLYAIGGFLVLNYLNTTNLKEKYTIMFSIIFVLVYAITDEVHQLFVPGRSGEVRDVFIDTLGASVGTLIFLMVKKLFRRY